MDTILQGRRPEKEKWEEISRNVEKKKRCQKLTDVPQTKRCKSFKLKKYIDDYNELRQAFIC